MLYSGDWQNILYSITLIFMKLKKPRSESLRGHTACQLIL